MPISIDLNDLMPQKVCIDCCNKLENTHLLAVSCLKTDMKLRKLLNIDGESEYENKYNTLVEKCLLETDNISLKNSKYLDSASFTINKDLETQNNSFQNIAVVVQSNKNTRVQTYTELDNKNNDKYTVKETLQTQQDKIQDGECNILCSQCQTLYETQEIFEDHKIFCVKNSEHKAISDILQNRKTRDIIVNIESETESSQAENKELENKQLINKSEICQSEQTIYCSVCSQMFKTQQDFNKHKHLHGNAVENVALGVSKKCGHCKECYHSKKDLLNHIVQSHEGQLLLQCFVCDKMYKKWSGLDIHEATHRLDKPYLCDLCGKSFKHSNFLRCHKRNHLDESRKKSHVCEICKKGFRSRFHLKEHKNQHEGNKPYTCEQCGKAFYKRMQLRQHKLSHGLKKYACSICSATFNRSGNMNTHVKRHNNENGTYECSVCAHRCKSMSELMMHRKSHTEEEIVDIIKKKSIDKKIWRCNVCNKVFLKHNSLVKHERTHRNDKTYVKCDECDKNLANKKSLMCHKKTVHLKEKPHMCQYCGDFFLSKEARLIHERKHTGECPYVCPLCNARYRCSRNFSQHKKTHTDQKPHKCKYCNKGFPRKYALTVHERIHTGVKPYPCEICGRCFSQKNDMLKHVKTHNSKLLQCGQCNEVFKWKKDLLKHTTMHEQDTLAVPNYVDVPSQVLQPYANTTPL